MASMLTTFVSTFATPDQPNPVLTNMFYHHTALCHAALRSAEVSVTSVHTSDW